MGDFYVDEETGERIPAESIDWNSYEASSAQPSGDYYVDEDTGEKIPASSVDWGQYEAIPQPSLYETATSLLSEAPSLIKGYQDAKSLMGANAFFSLGKGVSGLAEAAGDFIGSESLSNWGRETSDYANQFMDPRLLGVDPASVEGTVAPILGRSAAGLASVAANPLAGMATLTGNQFGERYADYKAGGAEPADAAIGAGTETAVSSALNLLGLNYIRGSAPTAGKAIVGGLTNALTSTGEQALANELYSTATGTEMTPEEYNASLLKAGIVGGGVGTAATGALSPQIPLSRNPSYTLDDAPAEVTLPAVRPQVEPPAVIADKSPVLSEDTLLAPSFPDVTKMIKEATSTPEAEKALVDNMKAKPLPALPPPVEPEPSPIISPEPTRARTPELQAEMGALRAENEAKTVPAMMERQAAIDKMNADVAEAKAKIDSRGIVARWGDSPDDMTPAPRRNSESGMFDPIEIGRAVQTGLRRLFYDDERIGKSSTSKSDDYFGTGRIASLRGKGPDTLRILAGANQDQEFRVKIPGLGLLREHMATGDRIKENFPEAGRVIDEGNNFLDRAASISMNARAEFDPFFRLAKESPEKTARVSEALTALRVAALKRYKDKGAYIGEIPPALWKSKGLSDAEIEALNSVRSTNNYLLDEWGKALKAKGQFLPDNKRIAHAEAVDEWVAHAKKLHYVPLSRLGEKYVVSSADAGDPIYMKFDSKKEALAAFDKLRAQGRSGVEIREAQTVTKAPSVGKNPPRKVVVQSESGDPLSLLSEAFDPDVYFQKGSDAPLLSFAKHMVEAEGVKGFDADLINPMKEYILGASRHIAKEEALPKINAAIEVLPEGSKIKSEMAILRDNTLFQRNSQLLQAYDSYLNLQYLAGTLNPGIGNFLQYDIYGPATMIKYVPAKKVAEIYGRSYKEMIGFAALRFKGAIAKTPKDYQEALSAYKTIDPDLKQALLEEYEGPAFTMQAGRDLALDAPFSKDVKGAVARGVTDLSSKAMVTFSLPEAAVRIRSFISGWYVGKEKGLEGPALQKFAKDFMTEVALDYRITNRPKLFRNTALGKLRGKFMMFPLAIIDWARKQRTQGNTMGLAGAMALTAGLGGVSATPVIGHLLSAAETLGFDWKKELRESLKDYPNASRVISRGVLSPLGFDFNSTIAAGSVLPNKPLSAQGILSVVGGVGVQPFVQAAKSLESLTTWDNPWAASKQMAPRAVRSLMNAYEAGTTGTLRDARRAPILEDVSPVDLGVLAAGGYPTRFGESYEKLKSAQILKDELQDAPTGFNHRLAAALLAKEQGDEEEFDRIMGNLVGDLEAYEEKFGVAWKPNDRQVDLQVIRMIDPELYELLTTPRVIQSEVGSILAE